MERNKCPSNSVGEGETHQAGAKGLQVLSPLMRLASYMSLGIIVTLLA